MSTDLAWPDVTGLLDGLSPGRREPWLLDGGVEVDRPRWRLGPDEVRLDVRGAAAAGPQTIGLLRTLLRHGGTGETGGRLWTLAVFEQAVLAGGERCMALLTVPGPATNAAPDAVPCPGAGTAIDAGPAAAPDPAVDAAPDPAMRAESGMAIGAGPDVANDAGPGTAVGSGLDALVDAVPAGEVLGWGVVANVVRERLHGEDLEVRRGLKHFTGGTKVWVSRPWNGDGGERLWVVGPGRRSRRPVRVIVRRIHLEHPRARAVYSPAVLRRLEGVPGMLHDTLGASRRWAASMASRVLEAEVDHPRRWLWVPDPPPMELDVDGTTVHLAHFNHRRARYSVHPPPTEPEVQG